MKPRQVVEDWKRAIVATHRVKAQMQHEVQGRREGIMQSSCLACAYRYSTHAHIPFKTTLTTKDELGSPTVTGTDAQRKQTL